MNAHRSALAAALLLAACSPTAPRTPVRAPLAGAAIGGPFTLTDQDGRPVTDASFRGKDRIVYFGYTFCPDVCPVDVQNLAAGLKLLEVSDPVLAAKVVPIFITVDPDRDTPAVLKAFVRAFHPRMIGLTGSPQAIASLAKAYGVYYKRGETTPGGGYMVNHTRQAYLMDPDGKPLALLPQDGTPQQIADVIRQWVT